MHIQNLLFESDRIELEQSFVYGSPAFRRAYKRYNSSAEWRRRKKDVRKRAEDRCEWKVRGVRCPNPGVDVHHLTYERFTNEPLTDLLFVCKGCHDIADRAREERNGRNFAAFCEERRRETSEATFFQKHFKDDDWLTHYLCDPDRYDDVFSNWWDKKRSGEDD